MRMTMTQKILARHAGLDNVEPGQLIEAKLDLVLGNDVTTPPAIDVFTQTCAAGVFDKNKVVLVPDHFTPNKDIKSADNCKKIREFAKTQQLKHYYEIGDPLMGVEHVILPENGLVAPGDVIIGADSHTCTYGALGAFATGVGSTDLACAMATGQTWFRVPEAIRFNLTGVLSQNITSKDLILYLIGMIGVDGALYESMEFAGPGVASLEMSDRFTICNMAIEAGGKNGIFPVDQKTLDYLKKYAPERFSNHSYSVFCADDDAVYERTIDIDLETTRIMKAHKVRQNQERLLLGEAWHETGYIFVQEHGLPIDPDTPSKLFQSVRERLELREQTLHDLRHLHATELLRHGVGIHLVKERLGHKDISVTLEIYGHIRADDKKAVADQFVSAIENG